MLPLSLPIENRQIGSSARANAVFEAYSLLRVATQVIKIRELLRASGDGLGNVRQVFSILFSCHLLHIVLTFAQVRVGSVDDYQVCSKLYFRR